jgi:hypothetical protein
VYQRRENAESKDIAPPALGSRWLLPRVADSLKQLDLLLIQVVELKAAVHDVSRRVGLWKVILLTFHQPSPRTMRKIGFIYWVVRGTCAECVRTLDCSFILKLAACKSSICAVADHSIEGKGSPSAVV